MLFISILTNCKISPVFEQFEHYMLSDLIDVATATGFVFLLYLYYTLLLNAFTMFECNMQWSSGIVHFYWPNLIVHLQTRYEELQKGCNTTDGRWIGLPLFLLCINCLPQCATMQAATDIPLASPCYIWNVHLGQPISAVCLKQLAVYCEKTLRVIAKSFKAGDALVKATVLSAELKIYIL